jgi:hypothetical protein
MKLWFAKYIGISSLVLKFMGACQRARASFREVFGPLAFVRLAWTHLHEYGQAQPFAFVDEMEWLLGRLGWPRDGIYDLQQLAYQASRAAYSIYTPSKSQCQHKAAAIAAYIADHI